MPKNLVIVESPAKAKTIEKYLGKDYKVMASQGHIRDLHKSDFSIDVAHGYMPIYEIPDDKKRTVADLKKATKSAEMVWLASDEDREGEAIAWHLYEVLGLKPDTTRRIVFHEITKTAILDAIQNPRNIDINLVNAQQARRVLDRIVGFELSPVLWRKIKPGLSAGRVQSVAVRLIADREKEIADFKSEPYFRVTGTMKPEGSEASLAVELSRRLDSREDAISFLEACKHSTFTVSDVAMRPITKCPAPPFTTSTLQQEAARKLGFSVAQTMRVAQALYEAGHITYMRTDSVNLSTLCQKASKEEIIKTWGAAYSKPRQYHTNSKGAQEAHEAIRPTYMNKTIIEGTSQEKRLYDLIWKRTAACQMADAEIEKTIVNISVSGCEESFVAQGEVIKFDGFMKVYRETANKQSDAYDDEEENSIKLLPDVSEGQPLQRREIIATERFSQGPSRYTEASLVHKLEELGIGRPSTYAPTISTIQQRDYVQKGDKQGVERIYTIDSLKGKKVTQRNREEIVGNEKGKLLPTDIGMVVNDFLMDYFPSIMDYNFTAKVEQRFDEIAEGDSAWTEMMKDFYTTFEPVVEKTMNIRSEHRVGERQVGVEPSTGKPVFVKIGRFGPVVQIGSADDKEKPRFAQIPSDKSMESITLDDALELFKLPREIGIFEGEKVVIGTGRFGPYVLHHKKYVSLPKDADPMSITLDEAVTLIKNKRQQEQQRHIKLFLNDSKLEILNGRYGPYIAYDGANYRIPKPMINDVSSMSYEQCMEIVNNAKPKKK